jgi:hypothetical protein
LLKQLCWVAGQRNRWDTHRSFRQVNAPGAAAYRGGNAEVFLSGPGFAGCDRAVFHPVSRAECPSQHAPQFPQGESVCLQRAYRGGNARAGVRKLLALRCHPALLGKILSVCGGARVAALVHGMPMRDLKSGWMFQVGTPRRVIQGDRRVPNSPDQLNPLRISGLRIKKNDGCAHAFSA